MFLMRQKIKDSPSAMSHLGDILDEELGDEIPGCLHHAAILPLTCQAWSQR